MAGIRLGNNRRTWHVNFRWEGRKCEFSTDLEDEQRARSRAQDVEDFRQAVLKKTYPIPDNVADVPRWIATLGRDGLRQNGATNGNSTLENLVAKYLEHRKKRLGSKTKPLSHSSYQSDVYRLKAFQDYCKRKRKPRLAEALSSETLGAYKDSLITAEEGAVSVKHKLRTVKALVMWAYDSELIDALPRNIRKYVDVDLPAPKPQFFKVKDVKRLYKTASDRVKLWILLGLNCGYVQSDISSLEPGMVDWENGVIRRDRQKTGVESQHRLWPITLKMLREQATDGPLLLTTATGQPLIREEIRDDGTPSKTDMIAHTFADLKKDEKVALSFKHFRKTAADAIAKQFQDKPWLVELFLAHSDPRMRKHYTRQHYDELHNAIEWLGVHFGFIDGEQATASK